jgi:hypothetical protein
MLLDEGKGLYGKAVEVSGEKWWFRDQYEYMNPEMKKLLAGPEKEEAGK